MADFSLQKHPTVASDMIKKMKSSILFHAEGQANQIRENAKSEATRNQSRYIYNEKIKITDDFKMREKAIIAQKSVKLSIAKSDERMQELKIKDEAVQRSLERAEERLKEYVSGPDYPNLLRGLVLQGLNTLQETEVQVAVKQSDAQTVQGFLGDLTREFQESSGLQNVQLSVSDYVLPDACIGGCVLICHEGKIQFSNTLKDRLNLACQDLYPQIRQIFFSN